MGNTSGHSVTFSVKNGSRPVDLFEGTRSETCDGGMDGGLAVNVTDVHQAPLSTKWAYEDRCAEVAILLPQPTPCKVNIDEVTAESISASITDSLCKGVGRRGRALNVRIKRAVLRG